MIPNKRKANKTPRILGIIIFILLIVFGMKFIQEELDDQEHDNNNLNVEEEQLDIWELSDQMIQALHEQDMQKIAEHVDPTKGLVFSPYVYIVEDAPVFARDEVASLLNREEIFNWGDYDGKGTPIKLTPAAYFDEFLDVTPQLDPDDVLVDQFQDRGNTVNNILDVYPDATVIEYYYEGSEEYAGIDWSSINLVYEKDDKTGALLLVAIVRDEWTV